MTLLAQVMANWPTIVAGATALPAGGLLAKVLDHKRATRQQTDEVALGLVQQLRGEIAAVEQRAADRISAVETAASQERQLCDAKLDAADHKLSVVRHELANVENAFDGLLLAIRFAPPERVPEIVQIAQQQRAERSRRKGDAAPAAA